MIYIFCFFASVGFAWLSSRSKDRAAIFVCSALSILVLSILGGLRHPFAMSHDITIYGWPDFRQAVASLSYIDLLKVGRHESGYLLVCYIAAKFFGSINWAMFFYQLIMITCFYIGAYKHKNRISLPLLVFVFCCMQYNSSYNFMRQGMACGIVFMGTPLLEERKYLKFSLYIIAASIFHTSALINFPLLLGVHMVMTSQKVLNSKQLKFFIFAGSVFVMIFIMPVIIYILHSIPIVSQYTYYLEKGRLQFYSSIRWSRVLLILTELIALTIYRKKAETIIMPFGKGGVTFYQFTLLFDVMYYLAVQIYPHRILMYSDYMNFIVLAAFPKLVKEKHLKALILMGLISVLLFYWWYTYIIKRSDLTWPYQSIL